MRAYFFERKKVGQRKDTIVSAPSAREAWSMLAMELETSVANVKKDFNIRKANFISWESYANLGSFSS